MIIRLTVRRTDIRTDRYIERDRYKNRHRDIIWFTHLSPICTFCFTSQHVQPDPSSDTARSIYTFGSSRAGPYRNFHNPVWRWGRIVHVPVVVAFAHESGSLRLKGDTSISLDDSCMMFRDAVEEHVFFNQNRIQLSPFRSEWELCLPILWCVCCGFLLPLARLKLEMVDIHFVELWRCSDPSRSAYCSHAGTVHFLIFWKGDHGYPWLKYSNVRHVKSAVKHSWTKYRCLV